MAGGSDPGRVVQSGHVADLGRIDQRQDRPGGARAGRAAGSVQIVLVIVRRIEVHDQADIVDVQAARSNVGRHEDPVKAPRARCRWFWFRLPWIAAAGTPAWVSCLASRAAPCLVRTKNSVRSGRWAISVAMATLSEAGSTNTR